MPISKIKTGSITDSAVNTDKLAPGSVGSSDISTDLVTGLTELSETAADTDFTIIYDTSTGTLKKILRSNLKQAGPVISSISPTNANDGTETSTFTITGTGFTTGSNARFIDANGKITEFDTVTRDSTTQITATIATSNLSGSNDPYDVQVTNGEGISSILTSQVNFNASPTFITASGSLGSDRFSMSGVEVNATDPESAGNVTFELQSGSLPPGISLVNTGANGGTATFSGTFSSLASSDTVYNFTLRAVDASSATSSRAFSFTAQGPQYLSFTTSGTFTVPTGLSSVDVLVVGAGGGGGSAPAPGGTGGGGAGGLIFVPGFPITPGTPISVTVGCGGPGTGQDSIFSTLTAKGGGFGGSSPASTPGGPGGSGGGGRGGYNGQSGYGGGTATQPTQPGQSGAYGFGNNGGEGGGGPPGDNRGEGGGGGGAGASGGNSYQNCGGTGKAYTIADGTTPVYYAGGGGGGGSSTYPSNNGTGGQGGGGNGGTHPGGAAQPGQANKGGGAGAPNSGTATGGKGIVIVKY